MSGNPRANNWSGGGKKAAKVAAVQEQVNTESLGQLRNTVLGITQYLYQLEQKMDRLSGTTRAADYRSRALSELLAANGVTQASVNEKIIQLQEQDFNQNSLIDDQQKGLEQLAPGTAAVLGNTVITTIRMFKGGVEVQDERVVRSKVELGKNVIFNPEFDNNIVGMTVGESKRVSLNLGNGAIDESEITLLGLSALKVAEETKSMEQSQES